MEDQYKEVIRHVIYTKGELCFENDITIWAQCHKLISSYLVFVDGEWIDSGGDEDTNDEFYLSDYEKGVIIPVEELSEIFGNYEYIWNGLGFGPADETHEYKEAEDLWNDYKSQFRLMKRVEDVEIKNLSMFSEIDVNVDKSYINSIKITCGELIQAIKIPHNNIYKSGVIYEWCKRVDEFITEGSTLLKIKIDIGVISVKSDKYGYLVNKKYEEGSKVFSDDEVASIKVTEFFKELYLIEALSDYKKNPEETTMKYGEIADWNVSLKDVHILYNIDLENDKEILIENGFFDDYLESLNEELILLDQLKNLLSKINK